MCTSREHELTAVLENGNIGADEIDYSKDEMETGSIIQRKRAKPKFVVVTNRCRLNNTEAVTGYQETIYLGFTVVINNC